MNENQYIKIMVVIAIFLAILISGCVEEKKTSVSPDGQEVKDTNTIQATTSITATQIITPSPTYIKITKSAKDIGLTINDFPTGWMMDDSKGNDTYYFTSFSKERYGAHFVETKITVLSSTDETRQALDRLKQDYSKVKLVSANLGDESFGWEFDNEANVVFRKDNLLVDVTYLREYGSSTIKDAKEYAEIIYKKI